MGYRETVIEESNKRALEVTKAIQSYREKVAELEAEHRQILGVLKSLGALNRTPIAVEARTSDTLDPDKIPVILDGQKRLVSRAVMNEIMKCDGILRTATIETIIKRMTSASDAGAHNITRAYVLYMLDTKMISRLSHGKYHINREATITPKERAFAESAGFNIVDGVVTTEEPPERGYGH